MSRSRDIANIVGAGSNLSSSTSIGNVSATEIGYLDGVTSAVQTQIDGKAASSNIGGAAVRCSGGQSGLSIPTGSWTAIAWTSEQFDTSSFHDTSSNNSRFTIPSGLDGTYVMTASFYWPGGSGDGRLTIRLNGSPSIGYASPKDVTTGLVLTCSAIYRLSAGDYVEAVVGNWTGTNTTLTSTNDSHFAIARIGA